MKICLINFSKSCDGKLKISLPWPIYCCSSVGATKTISSSFLGGVGAVISGECADGWWDQSAPGKFCCSGGRGWWQEPVVAGLCPSSPVCAFPQQTFLSAHGDEHHCGQRPAILFCLQLPAPTRQDWYQRPLGMPLECLWTFSSGLPVNASHTAAHQRRVSLGFCSRAYAQHVQPSEVVLSSGEFECLGAPHG